MSSGSAFAVTRMIGMNGSVGVRLELPADLEAVVLGIMTSSRIRSGRCSRAADSACVAVGRRAAIW